MAVLQPQEGCWESGSSRTEREPARPPVGAGPAGEAARGSSPGSLGVCGEEVAVFKWKLSRRAQPRSQAFCSDGLCGEMERQECSMSAREPQVGGMVGARQTSRVAGGSSWITPGEPGPWRRPVLLLTWGPPPSLLFPPTLSSTGSSLSLRFSSHCGFR